MKRKRIEYVLQDALDNGIVLRIRRKCDEWNLSGFVVGLGKEWGLLHVVNGDTARLNGYAAFRLKDVTKANEDETAMTASLRLRGEFPVPQPDILLFDLPGLLSSADAHFPLVTIHLEAREPDACYIGRFLRASARKATMRRIDPQAEWQEPDKFRLANITRVEFGDGYSAALHQVEQFRRQEKK